MSSVLPAEVLVPLTILLAAVMAASSVRKARGAVPSVELRDRLGVAPRLWSLIGVLEGCAALALLAGLVGGLLAGLVLLQVLGSAAAWGVALLMLGAVVVHLRARFAGRALLPPVVLLLVAVVVGTGFTGAG